MDRRTVLKSGGNLALAGNAGANFFQPSRAAGQTASTPGALERPASPKIRWWLPSDALSPRILEDQVKALAKAGFGAAEVINMTGRGWGSSRWREHLVQILDVGKRLGVGIDLTVGPHWPAAVKGIDPDGPAAAQILVAGFHILEAGERFDGPLPRPVEKSEGPPAPPPSHGETRKADEENAPPAFMGMLTSQRQLRLVGVTAHRILAIPDKGPIMIERESALDLTLTIVGGKLQFEPPHHGRWLVTATWTRGSGKTADGISPVIDHFSAAGTHALTAFWDQQLEDPRLRRAIFENGNDWFEDSIELTQHSHWTHAMAEEIARRRGFDIAPHLPVLLIDFPHIFTLSPRFDYSDGSAQRLRNDYFETLTQLYVEHHQRPMRAWANRHGLKLRQQPAYGVTLNLGRCAAEPDVPETESLWFAEKIDGYRITAGGAHIGGRSVISIETDAVVPPKVGDDAWSVTMADLLKLLHGHFAAGINQVVLHGFPYPDAPGAQWPGYGPFEHRGGGLGEAWGPASPLWRHMDQLTTYLARLQQHMRMGQPAIDIAILRHSYWDRGRDNWDGPDGEVWNDPALAARGYSFEYADPGLLEAVDARVTAGHLLIDGPAYRALILNCEAEAGQSPAAPPASASLTRTMLSRLESYCEAGLPIVIVGPLPSQTPFFSDRLDDPRIASGMSKLLAQANVLQVASKADVPEALTALGVAPRAPFQMPCPGLFVSSRQLPGGQIHFLYNQGKESTAQGYQSKAQKIRISLPGTLAIHRLDAWTGMWHRLPTVPTQDGGLTFELELAAHEAVLIRTGVLPTGARIVATAPGSMTTRRVLTDWHLTVQTWHPANEPANEADKTIKRTRSLGSVPLGGWTSLPGGEAWSGIARYATTIELDAARANADAAWLSLGPISGSAAVILNGQALPVDQTTFRANLSERLRPGSNTLTVEVASTLNNVLRVLPGGEGRALQHTGLIGPVTLDFTDASAL